MMNGKRTVSTLLFAALLLSFLSGLFTFPIIETAAAEVPDVASTVWVNHNLSDGTDYVELNAGNTSMSVQGGTLVFAPATGTLTMINATVNGWIYADGNLTVRLVGTNSITGSHADSDYSLRGYAGLTITGTGTLSVPNGVRYSIGAINGDLQFLGSAKVNVHASNADAIHLGGSGDGKRVIRFGENCQVTASSSDMAIRSQQAHGSIVFEGNSRVTLNTDKGSVIRYDSGENDAQVIFRDACTVNATLASGYDVLFAQKCALRMEGGSVTLTNQSITSGWRGGAFLHEVNMTGGTLNINTTLTAAADSSLQAVSALSIQDSANTGFAEFSGGTLNLNVVSNTTASGNQGRAYGLFFKGASRIRFTGTQINASVKNTVAGNNYCGVIAAQESSADQRTDLLFRGGSVTAAADNNVPMLATISPLSGSVLLTGTAFSGNGSYFWFSNIVLPFYLYGGNIDFTASTAVSNRTLAGTTVTHNSGSGFSSSYQTLSCSGTPKIRVNDATDVADGGTYNGTRGNLQWDASTRTVTLNNLKGVYKITAPVAVRVVLVGDNEIGSVAFDAPLFANTDNTAETLTENGEEYAMIIGGTGTLTIKGKADGIRSPMGNLLVTDSAQVTVTPRSGSGVAVGSGATPAPVFALQGNAVVTVNSLPVAVSGVSPSVILSGGSLVANSGLTLTGTAPVLKTEGSAALTVTGGILVSGDAPEAVFGGDSVVSVTADSATDGIVLLRTGAAADDAEGSAVMTVNGAASVTVTGGRYGIRLYSQDTSSEEEEKPALAKFRASLTVGGTAAVNVSGTVNTSVKLETGTATTDTTACAALTVADQANFSAVHAPSDYTTGSALWLESYRTKLNLTTSGTVTLSGYSSNTAWVGAGAVVLSGISEMTVENATLNISNVGPADSTGTLCNGIYFNNNNANIVFGQNANVNITTQMDAASGSCRSHGIWVSPASVLTAQANAVVNITSGGTAPKDASGSAIHLKDANLVVRDRANVTLVAEGNTVSALAARNQNATASSVTIRDSGVLDLSGGQTAALWLTSAGTNPSKVLTLNLTGGTLIAQNAQHPAIAYASGHTLTFNESCDLPPMYLLGSDAASAVESTTPDGSVHYFKAELYKYSFSSLIPAAASDNIASGYVPRMEIAGTQIRTADPAGIRFIARVSKDQLDYLRQRTGQEVSFGIVMQKESNLKKAGGMLTAANVTGGSLSTGSAVLVPGDLLYRDYADYVYYTAVVSGMPMQESVLSLDLVARAYIKCGSNYYYSTEIRPESGYRTLNAEAVGGGFSTSALAMAVTLRGDADVAALYQTVLDQILNRVVVGDQRYGGRVVAYDMSASGISSDLENAKFWEVNVKNLIGYDFNLDDTKFRYNTVAGDVIVYAGNSGIGVLDYKTKTSLYYNRNLQTYARNQGWIGSDVGLNIHSIEILPNGTLVVGGTSSQTVLFIRWNGTTWDSNPFTYRHIWGGHTVLFDGKYLWAGDSNEVHRFDLNVYETASGSETFDKEEVYYIGASNSIHCMATDFTDPNYMLVTGSAVWRFNKQTGESERISSLSNVKGVGITRNGVYYYTRQEGMRGVNTGRVRDDYQTRTIYKTMNSDLTGATGYESSSKPAWFYKSYVMDGFYN